MATYVLVNFNSRIFLWIVSIDRSMYYSFKQSMQEFWTDLFNQYCFFVMVVKIMKGIWKRWSVAIYLTLESVFEAVKGYQSRVVAYAWPLEVTASVLQSWWKAPAQTLFSSFLLRARPVESSHHLWFPFSSCRYVIFLQYSGAVCETDFFLWLAIKFAVFLILPVFPICGRYSTMFYIKYSYIISNIHFIEVLILHFLIAL